MGLSGCLMSCSPLTEARQKQLSPHPILLSGASFGHGDASYVFARRKWRTQPTRCAKFYWLLLIFAPQRDGQTDPLEAPPWTPGVLAHLVPSCGTHTAQKVESLRYIMARTAIRTDVGDPLPGPAAAPSGRPRLHGPPPASVIVPTPMPTAHGVDPTVYIASWSLVDGDSSTMSP